MISQILHIGLTVTDLDRSTAFYRDTLGLRPGGELLMEGAPTEALFRQKGCRARVGYLSCEGDLSGPAVELIQFLTPPAQQKPSDLLRTSISELCFETKDIRKTYERLRAKGVEFLSEPQEFDFTSSGFGKSKAVYFRDPDGIILELMEKI